VVHCAVELLDEGAAARKYHLVDVWGLWLFVPAEHLLEADNMGFRGALAAHHPFLTD
jgi:hypothetical protein